MEDENIHVYDENCTLIKVYLAGTENEISQQEGKKVYISKEKLSNPIITGGIIREMTTAEKIKMGILKLTDGQYLKKDELITVVKPSEFYLWDSTKKKWIYEKNREIEFLEERIGDIEISIMNVKKDMEKCKQEEQIFAVKRLQKQLDELTIEHDEKIKKYEELGGLQ